LDIVFILKTVETRLTTRPEFAGIVPVADETLTGILSVPFYEI
jgi:hypothetical protein